MGVITSDRWGLTPERLVELEAHGVTLVHEDPLKGIELPAVAYGETVLGEVTHEEAVIFRALWDYKSKVEAIDRGVQAEAMYAMADQIATHKGNDSTVTVESDEIKGLLEGDERIGYWHMRQTVGYLHALFHYTLGDRLAQHHVVLGLRSGGQIVRIEDR